MNVLSEECNLFVGCYPSNPLPHLHPFHFEIQRLWCKASPPFPNWWVFASISAVIVYITSQKCCPSCSGVLPHVVACFKRGTYSLLQPNGAHVFFSLQHWCTFCFVWWCWCCSHRWVLSQSACLVSFIHWRSGGRGEGGRWGDARDWVSVTWALCCAHRTGHKAKVNCRENQKVGKFPYHKKIPLLLHVTVDILLHNVCI